MIGSLPALYRQDKYCTGKPPMRNVARIAARVSLLAALLVLAACGTVKKFEPEQLTSIEAVTQPTSLWSAKVGSGGKRSVVKLAPFVAEETVFAANSEGEVSAFNRSTGQKLWEIDLGSELTAGVSGDDVYLYAGSGNGDVYCISQSDGSLVWTTRVSSEVISAPAAGGDFVVVRSIDGRVYALEKNSGKRRWLYSYIVPALSLHGNGRPLVVPDGVLIGLDNGRLVALRDTDGKVIWEARLSTSSGRSEIDKLSDLDADPIIDNNFIYAVNYQGVVAQIDPANGQSVWSAKVSSSAGLGGNDSMIVVSDEASTVWAFDKIDGSVLWKQENLSHRRLTAPAITDDGNIVVADYQGYLHILSGLDGSMIGRIKAAGDQIASRPVLRDNTLYTLGQSGKLSAIGL